MPKMGVKMFAFVPRELRARLSVKRDAVRSRGFAGLLAVFVLAGGCRGADEEGRQGMRTTTREGVGPPVTAPRPARQCWPPLNSLPCSAGVEVGVAYRYELYTHCGIRDAYFDGRLWVAKPVLSDGSGNPPAGWENPSDVGAMRLVSSEAATFDNGAGREANFVPAPEGYRVEPCA